MPTYPYVCGKCEHDFDVVRSMSEEFENPNRPPESCPKCGEISYRTIARSYVQPDCSEEYNPGLGCVVKSKAHKRQILKDLAAKGKPMEEVGTESIENIHKHFDRAQRDRRDKRWASLDKQEFRL